MEKIALIDLGSNTARLVIYDVLEGGYFVVSEERMEAVRLGETEADGSLKQTRIMQAIATLKSFKEICAIKGVSKVLAVATAAVRRASNQKTFLSDVFNATGIRVTTISEEEEANYVYQGVINSMVGNANESIVTWLQNAILLRHIGKTLTRADKIGEKRSGWKQFLTQIGQRAPGIDTPADTQVAPFTHQFVKLRRHRFSKAACSQRLIIIERNKPAALLPEWQRAPRQHLTFLNDHFYAFYYDSVRFSYETQQLRVPSEKPPQEGGMRESGE